MSSGPDSTERRVAVVTPADRLPGGEIARAMCSRGFDVALVGVDDGCLRNIALSVLRNGGRAVAIAIDRHQPAPFTLALDEIRARLGPIDVWIALCDGRHPPRPGSEPQPWEPGAFAEPLAWGVPEAFADMSAVDRGTLVVLQSPLAFVADEQRRTDCAAAFACRGYVESLRRAALSRNGSPMVSTVYARTPEPGSADVEAIVRHSRRTSWAVASSACDGRRQRIVGWRTWISITAARLFPGTFDHLATEMSTTRTGDDRSVDWQRAARAVRKRWHEMVVVGAGPR